MNAILFYLIFRGKKKRSVLNSESKGKGQVMHPSRLNVNLGGGGGGKAGDLTEEVGPW